MLNIRLFGRFSLDAGDRHLNQPPSGKPVELLCYLLLRRDRIHSREVLASLLWGDHTTAQSKKYLRQALWQLQEIVTMDSQSNSALLVDRDSIQFNPHGPVWLDVAAFENSCSRLQCKSPVELTNSMAEDLKSAVELYRGDLLEGWYQDWCLFERERLQNLYLLALDRLMAYCENSQHYDAALDFGERILRLDRAHEHTYQIMMRLLHRMGDRAAALRVYQRCANALQEELGVRPSHSTMELLDRIRTDCPGPQLVEAKDSCVARTGASELTAIASIVTRLRNVQSVLKEAEHQIEEHLQAFDRIESATVHPAPKRSFAD